LRADDTKRDTPHRTANSGGEVFGINVSDAQSSCFAVASTRADEKGKSGRAPYGFVEFSVLDFLEEGPVWAG